MIGVVLVDRADQATVSELYEGGPADEAGLRPGDEIVAVGDQAVTGKKQFQNLLSRRQPGEIVKLTITRDGWQRQVTVTLGVRRSVDDLPLESNQPAAVPQVMTGEEEEQEPGAGDSQYNDLRDPDLRAVDTDFDG